MERFKLLIGGLLALMVLVVAMPASSRIDHNRLFLPVPTHIYPTWCLTLKDGAFLTLTSIYGCGLHPSHDWVLVGFSDDDTDGDSSDNDEDICPTMPSGSDGRSGCPWQYWHQLDPNTTLREQDFDTDVDLILDWFDVCDDEEGTTSRLGCAEPEMPDQFCESISRGPRATLLSDPGSGRLFTEPYMIFHDRVGSSGSVYGMSETTSEEAKRLCGGT